MYIIYKLNIHGHAFSMYIHVCIKCHIIIVKLRFVQLNVIADNNLTILHTILFIDTYYLLSFKVQHSDCYHCCEFLYILNILNDVHMLLCGICTGYISA